jgi:hypothetical protein
MRFQCDFCVNTALGLSFIDTRSKAQKWANPSACISTWQLVLKTSNIGWKSKQHCKILLKFKSRSLFRIKTWHHYHQTAAELRMPRSVTLWQPSDIICGIWTSQQLIGLQHATGFRQMLLSSDGWREICSVVNASMKQLAKKRRRGKIHIQSKLLVLLASGSHDGRCDWCR